MLLLSPKKKKNHIEKAKQMIWKNFDLNLLNLKKKKIKIKKVY